MKSHLKIFFLLLLVAGCSGEKAMNEPPGHPVELTEEDRARTRATYEDVREWATWQMKGNALKSNRERQPTQEDLEQALYCFHKAQAAWPKKLPDSASETRKSQHLPVATDTLIAKGHVYLLLKNPDLSIYYYKKWGEYFPGNRIAETEIAKAEAMKAAP